MINALLEAISRLTLSVKSGRSWHRYRQQIVLYIFCRERTTMAKIAGHQQSRLPRFSGPYQSAIGHLSKLGKPWDHGPPIQSTTRPSATENLRIHVCTVMAAVLPAGEPAEEAADAKKQK
ncbi:hypothetical protein H0G86_008748 [Trichoderma simmonsii]|uniref:Uncharacterized protein n=1 Tax=Trichoderma simmonsii TaxID=1491479 RepID=A0A8G0LG78_9HYPO|nr:hypothetical protein H0G86_008748 [Trichoderma simmonsii]